MMSQTTDQTRTQTQWDTYFHGHVSADRKIELEKMKEKFDTWLSECNKKTFFKKPEVHTPLFHFHYDQILIYLKLLLRYINMCWPTLIVV